MDVLYSDEERESLSGDLLVNHESNQSEKNEKQDRIKTKMSLSENFLLSPWEKWKNHNRIPWKLIMHVLLTITTTAQVLIYNYQDSSYIRASLRNCDIQSVYSVNDTLSSLTYIRDSYYKIGEESIANYEYFYENINGLAKSEIAPIALAIQTNSKGAIRDKMNQTSLGDSFNRFTSYNEMALFVRSIESVEVMIRLRDKDFGPLHLECFDWNIQIQFEKVKRSFFRVFIKSTSLQNCAVDSSLSAIMNHFMWLNVIILWIIISYFTLIILSLLKSFKMYNHAYEVFSSKNDGTLDLNYERLSWNNLPFRVKLQFFKTRFVPVMFSMILLAICMIWNISNLVSHMPLSKWHRLLQGLGCMILWITFVSYLEHNKRFYSVVTTLKWGMPRVLRFLVGVFPIFFGYGIFGTVYFGSYVDCFCDLSTSFVTLFSVMNGDIILDTFDTLNMEYPIIGKVYLYTFITLFMYVVLNIFIAIVEEAFSAARRYKRPSEKLFEKYQTQSNAEEDFAPKLFKKLLEALENESDP